MCQICASPWQNPLHATASKYDLSDLNLINVFFLICLLNYNFFVLASLNNTYIYVLPNIRENLSVILLCLLYMIFQYGWEPIL